jgi:hypothetical protein
MAAFNSTPRPKGRKTEPASSVNVTIPRNEEQYQRGRGRPKTPSAPNPRRSGFSFLGREKLKKWEEHKAIDDLTKQRNEDRAKGLMPAPGPRRPWIKLSFPAPSNESRQLMSPSMRRQCDVWGKAYEAQQRLEGQVAKRKREEEDGGEKKKPRSRRSGSRSSRGNAPPGNPPPPPPGNPPSGGSSAGNSSARDFLTRDPPAGGSRPSGSSTRNAAARDPPAGPLLASKPPSNTPLPTPVPNQNAEGDGSGSQTTSRPPRRRTGADAFSKVPMPSSRDKRAGSKTSPSPPPPKKHKAEASESENLAGDEDAGPDEKSQSSVPSSESVLASSSSEDLSEEEDEQEEGGDNRRSPSPQPERTERTTGSAPPELPPVRDNNVLDAASVLLASFEQRETQSAPPELPTQDDH